MEDSKETIIFVAVAVGTMGVVIFAVYLIYRLLKIKMQLNSCQNKDDISSLFTSTTRGLRAYQSGEGLKVISEVQEVKEEIL